MAETSLNVLLLEDDQEAAALMTSILKRAESHAFLVHHCACLQDALKAVQSQPFDIALLDLKLPDSAGVHTIEAVRAAAPDLPIVVVTGDAEEDVLFDAMEKGAQDYLFKGHALSDLLVRSIHYTIENKRQEDALLREKNVAQTYLDIAGVVILVLDAAGTIQLINKKGCNLLGYARGDLLGREWFAFLPEHAREGVRAIFRSAMQDGDLPVEAESEVLTRDGHVRRVAWQNALLRDRDGRVTGTISSGLDVTKARRAEARQRLSCEVLTLLNRPDTGGGLIHEILRKIRDDPGSQAAAIRLREGVDYPFHAAIELSAGFLEAESTLCRTDDLGYVCRDASGMPVLDCLCGAVISGKAVAGLDGFTAGGSFVTGELSALQLDALGVQGGCSFRNRCRAEGFESVALVPLHGVDDVIGLLMLLDRRKHAYMDDDIAFFEGIGASIGVALARQNIENVLRDSERKYRELAGSLPQVVFELDCKANLTFANQHAFAAFGYTQEDFDRGLNALDMVVPEDRNRALNELTRGLAGQDLGALEFTARRKDGTTFPVLIYINRLVRNGLPTGVTGIVVDLTERKNLEAQFLQAQKMEVVGRLAGGVAHDFNNLLTVINGYADVLTESLNDDAADAQLQKLNPYVSQILSAGRKAEDITRKLLTFSRRQRLDPRVIDLNNAIFDMDKMLRRFIGEDVELIVLPHEHLGTVQVDPSQVEQALINLVVNARDAMPQGGSITIETGNETVTEPILGKHDRVAPGQYVVISVRDTGTGMTDDVLAHAFEPFFSTKETGKGTGLGLATVYGIVKQAHGHILTHSQLGKGTMFKVYFPRSEATLPENSERTVAPPDMVGGEETILVAEDERSVREFIRTVLERHGYTVLEASNGIEALNVAKRHAGSIDLLLTDIVMPKMGGYDLARTLRESRADLHVLYMSGYAETERRRAVEGTGPYHFLHKPFVQSVLLDSVRKTLDMGA